MSQACLLLPGPLFWSLLPFLLLLPICPPIPTPVPGWPCLAPGCLHQTPWRVSLPACFLVSGVYDLEPLVHTSVNGPLRLTP